MVTGVTASMWQAKQEERKKIMAIGRRGTKSDVLTARHNRGRYITTVGRGGPGNSTHLRKSKMAVRSELYSTVCLYVRVRRVEGNEEVLRNE